jgi:hypothetical protein
LQRWAFVGLAFVLFHLYARRGSRGSWHSAPSACWRPRLPFSFMNDLQESSAL